MLQDFVHTPALRDAMTSKDHKAWYMPMVLSGGVGTPELHEGFGRVANIVKESVAGSTLTANLTGPAATGDDLMFVGIRDMHVIETAVVVMVLVILFVIYRNFFTMMLPLITIGVSVGVAQSIVAGIAELGLGVSSQTITLMTTMMAGAGIDYAVFLISRYHDYLRQGMDSDEAVAKALTSIGKVIAGLGGHRVGHLPGDGLHPVGSLQERRSGAGLFHRGGAVRGRDVPAGPDGADREARLDQAARRSHQSASGGARESASCASRWPIWPAAWSSCSSWPAARCSPASTTTTARPCRKTSRARSDTTYWANTFR